MFRKRHVRAFAEAEIRRSANRRNHMRRLILFRHAKSAWPQGVPDNERPLAERGRLAAPLMGAYIARHGLIPDLALVSPARRTEQTWHFATADWPQRATHGVRAGHL